jgi:hypothetical protein
VAGHWGGIGRVVMLNRRVRWLFGLSLWIILGLSPVRALLESSMATHMLVQIPLLVVAGALGAAALPAGFVVRLDPFNRHGATGTALAIVTTAYWMIPLNLDATLAGLVAEIAKFITVPLAAGIAAALSWGALPAVAKGLILAQMVIMLGVLGWLYREVSVRLCSYYLAGQQVICSDVMLFAAVLVPVGCLLWTFIPRGYHASLVR